MLKTESGRMSRTILIHLVLGIAGQSLAMFGWLASVLSTETWAIVAGILGTVQAIAGIYERLLAGQPVVSTETASARGEPMARPKPPSGPVGPTGLVGIVVAVLLLTACVPSPWARYPVQDGAHQVHCAQRLAWDVLYDDAEKASAVVTPVCDGEPLPLRVRAATVVLPGGAP